MVCGPTLLSPAVAKSVATERSNSATKDGSETAVAAELCTHAATAAATAKSNCAEIPGFTWFHAAVVPKALDRIHRSGTKPGLPEKTSKKVLFVTGSLK